MTEPILDHYSETSPPVKPRIPEPSSTHLFLVCFTLFLLGSALSLLIPMILGWPMPPVINEYSDMTQRFQVRVQLGLSHLLGFCMAGLLTVRLFYKGYSDNSPDWRDYLMLRRMPSITQLVLGVLLILVSVPLVLYTFSINKLIPLPDMLKMMESDTASALKGLLIMDNIWELLLNLTIIAVLPAIGEELVFRGILQRQLMRHIKSPWLAIVLSAAIFSAIHFQFEGFLPRFILGIILGWLYWQTRNFWVPVMAHFANNALQVIGQYLYGKQISTVDLEQDVEVPWHFAVMSIFLIFVVARLMIKLKSTGEHDVIAQ